MRYMKNSGLYRRRTKIVCTIGPATGSVSEIERLILAGMNIARLNLSHGTHQEHAQYIQNAREASQHSGLNVAILIDLPGPKYRIGRLKNGEAFLRKGAEVILTIRQLEGDSSVLPVNLPSLPQAVNKGNTILLADGAVQLKVQETQGTEVKCKVMVDGVITEGNGLVVPGMSTSGPFVTDSFLKHILFAIEQKPDYLAISFVRNTRDVKEVKAILDENKTPIPIISKIERGEAVRNFDSILESSYGIMVARGDLGVDIPLERVPLIQKEIIKKCNRAGKPVITATQMLESMINSASPTRAEVTDVANAIFDGTDAIMLSAETSIGKYPTQATKMMAKVAREAEIKLPYEQILAERGKWLEQKTDELISYNACYTAHSLGAKAIVAFTHSGSTAGRVSKYRPKVPVLAITPHSTVSSSLLIRWGVYPFQMAEQSSVDDLFATASRLAKELSLVKPGDLIIITGGIPIGVTGSTNLLKVERIT